MKKYRSWLVAALVLNIMVLLGYGIYYYRDSLPEKITIITGEDQALSFRLPFSAKIEGESVGVVEVNREPLEKGSMKIDLSDAITMEASEKTSMTMEVKLFGIVPLKKVEISAVSPQSVAVGGSAIGLHIETDGILVLGTTTVTGEDKMTYEPAENRLKSGDYITFAGNANGTLNNNPTLPDGSPANELIILIDTACWDTALGGIYSTTITFNADVYFDVGM